MKEKLGKGWVIAVLFVAMIGLGVAISYWIRGDRKGPLHLGESTLEDAEEPAEVLEDTERIVAKFGSYEVRLFRTITDFGGAHPETENHYEVTEMKEKKLLRAMDVFTEKALVSAFVAVIDEPSFATDPKTKAEYKKLKAAKSLAELERSLDKLDSTPIFSLGENCDGEPIAFEPTTENFAVLGYVRERNKAIVHFGIDSSTHACNSVFPRLKLEVDVPDSLKESLLRASSGAEGFFPKASQLKVCDACEPIDFTVMSLGGA